MASMVVNVGKSDEGRIIANQPIDGTQPSGFKEVLVAICPGQLATTAHISLRYEVGMKEATRPAIYPVKISGPSNPSSRAWTESEYIPSIVAKGRPLRGSPPYHDIWTWGRQSYDELNIVETSDTPDGLAFDARDIHRRFWCPLSIFGIETSSASELYQAFERQSIVCEYLQSLIVRCRNHVVELLTKSKAPPLLSVRWVLVGGYGRFQDDDYRNRTEDVILKNLLVKALVDSRRLGQFDKIDFPDPLVSALGDIFRRADPFNQTGHNSVFKRGNKILLCGCGESRIEISALQIMEEGPILDFSRIMNDKFVEGGVIMMQSGLIDLVSKKMKIDLQKTSSWYQDQILMGLLDIEATWKPISCAPGQPKPVRTKYVGSLPIPSNSPEYKFEKINIEISRSEFMKLYEPVFEAMNDQINLVVSSDRWKDAKGEAFLLFWTATGFQPTFLMTSRLCTSGPAAAAFRGTEGAIPNIFGTPTALILGRGAILNYLDTTGENQRCLYSQRFGVNISPPKQSFESGIRFWIGGDHGSADKVLWLQTLYTQIDGEEPTFLVKCSFPRTTSFPMRLYIKILTTKEDNETPVMDEAAAGWVYLREDDVRLRPSTRDVETLRYRVNLFFNFKIYFERSLADIEVKFKQSDPPKIFWPVEFEWISVKAYREMVLKRRAGEASSEKPDAKANIGSDGDIASGIQYDSVPKQKEDSVSEPGELSPVSSRKLSVSEQPRAVPSKNSGYFENAASDSLQPWPIEFVEAGSAQRLENSIVGVEGLNLTENQSKERGRASWGTKY